MKGCPMAEEAQAVTKEGRINWPQAEERCLVLWDPAEYLHMEVLKERLYRLDSDYWGR